MEYLLREADEARFKYHARTTKECFFKLDYLIRDSSVFANDLYNEQRDVEVQLLAALKNLGTYGNNGGVEAVCRIRHKST